MKQGTFPVSNAIGKVFSCDVIRRERQKILVLLDSFSSFMIAQIIPNEKHESLREAIIQLSANYKHPDGSIINVDNAPGFQSLKEDAVLKSIGIDINFGRIKNKNQNACVDKGIQELENEIKRMAPRGGEITPGTLAIATSNLNHRIRSNGLCSKEILFRRDMYTNDGLNFTDDQIQNFKYSKRIQNHPSSEKSKSRGGLEVEEVKILEGDIVHLKHEGSKHHAREFYLVTSVDFERKEAFVQKFCNTQLRSRKYRVKLAELYPAATNFVSSNHSDSSGDIDIINDSSLEPRDITLNEGSPQLRRSARIRNTPDYLATSDIQRIPSS